MSDYDRTGWTAEDERLVGIYERIGALEFSKYLREHPDEAQKAANATPGWMSLKGKVALNIIAGVDIKDIRREMAGATYFCKRFDENGKPLPGFDENGRPYAGYAEDGRPIIRKADRGKGSKY